MQKIKNIQKAARFGLFNSQGTQNTETANQACSTDIAVP